jgi:hypothetical protein
MRTILIIFATIPLDARATATALRLFPLAASRFQLLHVESSESVQAHRKRVVIAIVGYL